MNRIKKSYFIILFIIVFVVSTMYFSYAFFASKSEHHGKLNIVAGTLDYKIESKELVNNKVTVGYNETKVIDIKLTSLNDIDSKYEIYYNFLTSLTATEIGRVNIGYTTTNKDSISGEIDANKSKNIRIYINNSNDKDIEIEFNVIGGLTNDSLVLNNGNKLVTNDITIPDYDIKTEIIDGKTYAVIDTNDNQSGVKQVEYNGQIQSLPKNRDDYKIYLSYSSFYSSDYVLQKLFKYKNVSIMADGLPSVDDIVNGGYNLVFDFQSYWNCQSAKLESIFQYGINIYSNGNNTNDLSIFATFAGGGDSSSLTNLTKVKDNILTRVFINNSSTTDNGQTFVKFKDDVEVWYQGTFNGVVYDALGIYRKNGVGWMHNQSLLSFGSAYFDIIADYLLKINTAEYEITESGDYTFKVTDYAGNIVEKTIHIDV